MLSAGNSDLPMLPVPTNLITGFLGVGKTTAIKSLLARKPEGEVWAVLVNEFGDIGIDAAAIGSGEGGDDDLIRMVPGGCICCVGNMAMGVALADLIRKVSPARLLIEPTGLGHPAGVLDLLREAESVGQIDLRATICLVDPRRLAEINEAESEIFQDQIHMADALIAHKCDLSNMEERAAFTRWAAELFPPKSFVGAAVEGGFDTELLDLDANPMRTPLFPDAHAHTHDHHHHRAKREDALKPGVPVRATNTGLGHKAYGWIFSPEDVFNRRRLLELLSAMENIVRLKGVFRTGRHWMLVDKVGDELRRTTIAYKRDSRIELIVSDRAAQMDWQALEGALVDCLRPRAITKS